MLTKQELQNLKELESKAFGDPWRLVVTSSGEWISCPPETSDGDIICTQPMPDCEKSFVNWDDNAPFIIALRNSAKSLIDQAGMVEEWQPLETAPRDGTTILTWDPLFLYQITSYNTYEASWADEDDKMRHGWNQGDGYPTVFEGPTYWIPLQKPPVLTNIEGS
jgi:hypothetical protein